MQQGSACLASDQSFYPRTTASLQPTLTWLAPPVDAQGYDLSLNRTKEQVDEEVEQSPPLEILVELRAIEQEILHGIEELEGMLR
jgi:type I restriction enzyme M protein